MPRKIPLPEIRNWLKQYESGKSVAAIAKNRKRDVRTIQQGIDKARREREAHTARAEMMKDALQRHQDDLSDVLDSILSAIVIPPPELGFPIEVMGNFKIELPKATAKYDQESDWAIQFAEEKSVEWELFIEHTKHDAIWRGITQWRNAVIKHLETRRILMQRIFSLLRDKTDLEVVEIIDKDTPDQYLLPGGVSVIYHFILDWALGISANASIERELKIKSDYLYYGRDNIPVLFAQGHVGEYKEKAITVVKELQNSQVISQIIDSYSNVKEGTKKASKTIEELVLLRLVPGQCRVCKRLGLG